MKDKILDKAKSIENQIIAWRRDIHKHPEPGFEEVRTARIIANELEKLGIETMTGVAKTGVVGTLRTSDAKMTVAFRADMDALRMPEETDLEYKSVNPGVAHACGHDAHVAVLLGAATIITSLKDKLKCNVKFIFQPSEETPPGGARLMIDEGVLDGVDEIFGLHVDPNVPAGIFALRSGSAMAAADKVEIKIIGKGGHAAVPHLCVDPVVISAEVISALQTIASRGVDPINSCVVSICQISGGTSFNVIPDSVTLIGTVRTLTENVRQKITARIEDILKGITLAHRAEYELDYTKGYPPLANHVSSIALVERNIKQLFGDESTTEIAPKMGGEDFAFYLQKVKGAFFFLGARNASKGVVNPHHNPKFTIDEDILYRGSALFAHIACTYLNEDQQ